MMHVKIFYFLNSKGVQLSNIFSLVFEQINDLNQGICHILNALLHIN